MKTLRIFSKLGTTTLIALCLSIAACSSTPSKEDRDTSGKYDGTWIAKVHTANSPQRIHNWQLQCADLSREMQMKVADGEISVQLGDATHSSYINAKGKFLIQIKAGKTSASAASDASLSNPNVRVMIKGSLGRDPAKGVLIVGLAEVGFAGCESKIDYRKA